MIKPLPPLPEVYRPVIMEVKWQRLFARLRGLEMDDFFKRLLELLDKDG